MKSRIGVETLNEKGIRKINRLLEICEVQAKALQKRTVHAESEGLQSGNRVSLVTI